jgi:hypothetical protein
MAQLKNKFRANAVKNFNENALIYYYRVLIISYFTQQKNNTVMPKR